MTSLVGSRTLGVRSNPLSTTVDLIRTARPRQWVKNVLVLAAPFAGRSLFEPHVAGRAFLALLAFTAAAAATYCLNDVRDAATDRRDAVRATRPVAAGRVSANAASVTALALGATSLALAALLGWQTLVVLIMYLALTTLYSTRLKHMAVLDVLAVAGGFLLRAVAGGVATGTRLSDWFLLVALFGSLFLVAAKRSAEQVRCSGEATAGEAASGGAASGGAASRRAVLDIYPASWLQQMTTMALTGAVVSYAMWAFQYLGADIAPPLLAASLVPFLAGMMRYALLVTRGAGETPERLLLADRFLLIAGGLWVSVLGVALYLV
ncbi:MAG TPA: decaprenyl-phosphate phosphoribosyltransferase [Actinomycetales bacterium]|nr:decaprenyl-phosphate phosphoribosyltransferase [Actinomycetales bacterium]